ncbi:transcriptional repressor [Candidatus Poribacteria bacterium]|nr:transcriptional repressor [Candidatus Poribacteria bacterium]
MNTREEQFRRYLKSSGLKFTPERRLILGAAFSIEEHFEAEELFLKLWQQGDRVSKATIYRTLPLLVKSGLLREVVFGEKHAHYEHVYGHQHHEHLVCINCGKIIEVSSELLENLQTEICEQHDFEAISHKFEITGYCKDCRLTVVPPL